MSPQSLYYDLLRTLAAHTTSTSHPYCALLSHHGDNDKTVYVPATAKDLLVIVLLRACKYKSLLLFQVAITSSVSITVEFIVDRVSADIRKYNNQLFSL